MIQYQKGNEKHYEAIARLHAYSWQHHYRGIFNDDYLEHQVIEDRIQVWQRRFDQPTSNQYVLLAQDDQLLCGFGCIYLNHHPSYGTLLDNLHVHPDWQGKGIGKELMKRCSEWMIEKNPESKLYLWVLKDNKAARLFYENLGGSAIEEIIENNPGGGSSEIVRIVWNDPLTLLN